ncbi:oligomycin resistance ATP-dependent permease Yor1p [[Candida] railenensis]|uniref:Oligomycin resistance ATP-dependent permease Yor1p n=1 Tax=[Candida] railenensis TaxID=45579 RepID=A0A9P0QK36_9ASCO|nr:oligomycin resistance ATP-dependent permease Yor1p [[Candida] railenensis]
MSNEATIALENGAVLVKQKRLLSRFFTDKVPPIPLPEERLEYGYNNANILSKVFFWWLHPILKTGYIRTLTNMDLFKLAPNLTADVMAAKFNDSLSRRANGNIITKKIMVLSLIDVFFKQYFLACVCLLLSSVCSTVNPLLVRNLILFVEDRADSDNVSMGKGVGYAIGVALLSAAAAVFNHHFLYRATTTGAQARSLLTKVIFDKSCKLSARARHDYPIGTLTSIMGTDVSRVDFALGYQPYFIVFIFPTAIAIALLVINIGVSSLVGIGVMFLFLVALGLSTIKLGALRRSVSQYTDKRVNYIKEVLYNLKIIKYYSWEESYVENITEVRKSEMRLVFIIQTIRNALTSLAYSLNVISYMVAFLVLYAIDSGRHNPAAIFSSISLFNVLNQQMVYLPLVLPASADMLIALDKIGKFLSAEEDEIIHGSMQTKREDNVALEIKDADFEWEIFEATEEGTDGEVQSEIVEVKSSIDGSKDEKDDDSYNTTKNEGKSLSPFKLENLNLEIKRGDFVVIVGSIGSGKSSLLQAIAGFMKRTKGEVNIYDSSLLCGPNWVQSCSIRDNVTFGSDYDADLYREVMDVCCLQEDMNQLTAGDMTEVGERGITLSGGQKARLNLARAIYKQKSIILLDDILSAVDAKVGKEIIEKCILGFLSESTRILATHQLSLIGSADKLIFMEKNGSLKYGTLEELNAYPNFVNFMKYDTLKSKNTQKETNVEEIESELDIVSKSKEASSSAMATGKTVTEEERAVNSISFEVYKQFISAGSGIFTKYGIIPVVIIFVTVAVFCTIFTNTWLSFWTSDKFPTLSSGQYIGIYVMFTCLAVIFLAIQFGIMAYFSTTSSEILNIYAIQKIVRVPMSYMDVTPMGRILNRFTKDTDVLDNEFGTQLRLFVYSTSLVIGVFILCICYLPWFALSIPPFTVIFFSIGSYYLATAREIKRLEAVKRSFVYNNFNETLQGMDVIKAFNSESHFKVKNSYFIDSMCEAYYITIANQRWFCLNMDLLAAAFVLIVALLCVCGVFNIGASSSGLVVTYVLQVASSLTIVLRSYTNIENEMNSVERVQHYAFKLPQEAPPILEGDAKLLQAGWPNSGTIEFKDVSMKYRPGLPLVLNNVDIKINSGEKIGICGRTGAGKSSIVTALYRISEIEGGQIYIDGVDISQLGLKTLRSNLSIIPQDPTLFYGSIRKNLDPFQYSTDDKLWNALRRVGLVTAEEAEIMKTSSQTNSDSLELKFGLDQIVEDNGSNFSLGEKQLIALARALIRDTKILVLDEATSSVDYKTDAFIQKIIAAEFTSCTVLSIAHRLKTILDYDKILVLDKGSVAEYDNPKDLFSNKKSIFRDMCLKSHISEEDFHNKS